MTLTARHLGLGLVILAIAGAIAITALADPGPSERGYAATAAGKGGSGLKLRGKVTGLVPGAARKIKVKVRNNYPRTVQARPREGTGPHCRARVHRPRT